MPVFNSQHVFVHIPKTGGQSISKAMGERVTGAKLPESPFKAHWTALEIKKVYPAEFEKYFKFSVVRHPLARLVSEYGYFRSGRMARRYRYWDTSLPANLQETLSFSQFLFDIRDHCISHPNHNIRCRYYTMKHYLYDEQGKLMVDKVFRHENFQEVEDFILKTGGKELIHKNKSTHEHFLSYYTKETLAVAQALYEDDFAIFGYELLNPDTFKGVYGPCPYN